MSSPEAAVRVLKGYRNLLRIEPQWERLFAAAEAPLPFLRHRWLRLSWTERQWRFPSRPMVIMVEEGGEPVMGGAFVLTRRRFTPSIQFLAPAAPQYQDVLYRKSDATPGHAALMVEALQGAGLARVFRPGGWLADSPLRQAMAGLESKNRGRVASSAIDLTRYPSFADYMKRSSNLAHDHKRQLKRLAELPDNAFTLESGDGRIETLRWLFATKTRWAEERDKVADWLYDGSNERFTIAALSGENAQPAWVGTLRTEGRIIAAVLAYAEAGVLYGSKLAFDPEFARMSPARTLVLMMLERAFAEGFSKFDLMLGPQSWKSRLADIERPALAERIQLR